MTEIQGSAPAETAGSTGPSGAPLGLRALRQVIWVYGGFLLGMLTHAWWSGDDDPLFWPWSLAFMLLLIGWLIWQRRSARRDGRADQRDGF